MCWENRLYDAMIYVYNSGMNDYITPMEVGSLEPRIKYLLCLSSVFQKTLNYHQPQPRWLMVRNSGSWNSTWSGGHHIGFLYSLLFSFWLEQSSFYSSLTAVLIYSEHCACLRRSHTHIPWVTLATAIFFEAGSNKSHGSYQASLNMELV